MGLISRLRGWANARPRVLVVDVPGSEVLRWTVEAELDRRGWLLALSPADTDVLLVLGTPGPQLTEAVDVLWSQVPEPRHRLALASTADVRSDLDAAVRALVQAAAHPELNVGHPELPRQVAGARDEHPGHGPAGPAVSPADPRRPETGRLAADGDHPGTADHEGMDHSATVEGMDHSAMAGHGGMEHSGHEGMDHSAMAGHGHHMHHGGEVAGLAMAETAPDRDGLALDVLHLALGPVLPGWPTGLMLRADLQGDVLTGARLSWVDPGHDEDADPGGDPLTDGARPPGLPARGGGLADRRT